MRVIRFLTNIQRKIKFYTLKNICACCIHDIFRPENVRLEVTINALEKVINPVRTLVLREAAIKNR